MKIHVSIPQTIDLTHDQMVDITLGTLKQLFDIPEYASINKDGALIEWTDTHGSGFDHYLRKATDEDKKVLEMIQIIQNKVSELNKKS